MKLVTGVSTDMDFIKQVNEHGANLTIGSTPDKLLESLGTDESLNITYESDNETIVGSVNREVQSEDLVPDLTLDLSSAQKVTFDGSDDVLYRLKTDYTENTLYNQYLTEFLQEGSFNGHTLEVTLPDNENITGYTRNDCDVLGTIFICTKGQHSKPIGYVSFLEEEEEIDDEYITEKYIDVYISSHYDYLVGDYFLSLRSFDIELGESSNIYTKTLSATNDLDLLDFANNLDSADGKSITIYEPCYGYEMKGIVHDSSFYALLPVYETEYDPENGPDVVGYEESSEPTILFSVSDGKLRVEVPKTTLPYDYYIPGRDLNIVFEHSENDGAYIITPNVIDTQFLKAYLESVENEDNSFSTSNIALGIADNAIVNPTITDYGFVIQDEIDGEQLTMTLTVDSSSDEPVYLLGWTWNSPEE